MIVKKKKIILTDEVHAFLNYMGNDKNKYERDCDNILVDNYTLLNLEDTEKFIDVINNLNLSKEDKFNIINNKPKDEVELSVLVKNINDKLTKKQIQQILKFINDNKIN